MELKNTVKMMVSDDYQERFRAEYFQLKIRLKGLENMLIKYGAGELKFTPKCSYDLLHGQYLAMKMYQDYLLNRAVIEEIILEED